MFIEIILSIILGVISLYYVLNYWNIFKKWKIPQVPSLPIVGSMLPVVLQRTSLVDYVHDLYCLNKTAKYIGLYNFSTPVIMVRDPDLIKIVMVKAFDHFSNHRGFIEPKQDPFFAASTFSRKGNEWRAMRSRLSTAFTASKIKSMYPLTTKCAEIFGDHLVSQFFNQPGDIDLKDIFSKFTNDIIATCEYGCEVDSMKNPNNDFYVLGRSATDFEGPISKKFFLATSFPWLFRLFNIRMVEQKVVDFFGCLVKETIQLRREKNIKRPDVLQILMDTNDDDGEMMLSPDEIAAQAFSFFFATFDTLSTVMCFGFYELAKNQDVQERLFAEVNEVLIRTGGEPKYEDVMEMKYLEAVINESLRYHPAAVFTDRVCTKAFELPSATDNGKPIVIKPGQNVWIPIREIHRDADYYERPEIFDPERFLENAKKSIAPGTFMPFGYGPRICLGQRFALFGLKIVFFQLIARCEFSSSERMEEPFRYSRKSFAMLPDGGFWLRAKVRDSWKNRSSQIIRQKTEDSSE